MSEYKFPVTTQLRLDWSELDLLGHINNVMYFKYLQAARISYSEQIGLRPDTQEGLSFILADTRCTFLKPLFFPGNIIIRTSVEFMKTSSFGLCHHIHNDNGELAAEGHDIVVLYNIGAAKTVHISPELRAKVEALEERKLEAPNTL